MCFVRVAAVYTKSKKKNYAIWNTGTSVFVSYFIGLGIAKVLRQSEKPNISPGFFLTQHH